MKLIAFVITLLAPLLILTQLTVIFSVIKLTDNYPDFIDLWIDFLREKHVYKYAIWLGYAFNMTAVFHTVIWCILYMIQLIFRFYKKFSFLAYVVTFSLSLSLLEEQFRTISELEIVKFNAKIAQFIVQIAQFAAQQAGMMMAGVKVMIEQIGVEIID